jgi:hypothetical protein
MLAPPRWTLPKSLTNVRLRQQRNSAALPIHLGLQEVADVLRNRTISLDAAQRKAFTMMAIRSLT